MDCFCDYDPPEVYRAREHKARKARPCTECGGHICPGERYEHVWGVWEGQPGTHNTCTRCLDLRDWVGAHVPCFCWAHHNLFDDAIETARTVVDEAPGLLFGTYRRFVLIQRARCQGVSHV